MMKDVTGAYFKPLFPAYVLNNNCSPQYYFSGTINGDHINNQWACLTTQLLTSINMDSMRSNNDNNEGVCEGIRVKYACGRSAVGFIYSIYIIASGLSKDELPIDEFFVILIEGLSTNGHIDPRNKEVGYMCFNRN